MLQYIPVREELCTPELGTYVSYGIRAVLASGEETAFVSDVSTDQAFVEHLAMLCTMGQLSPIHLRDVIEDAI